MKIILGTPLTESMIYQNNRIILFFLDSATKVDVNIFVRSFSKIDDVKMVSRKYILYNTYKNQNYLKAVITGRKKRIHLPISPWPMLGKENRYFLY